MVRSLVVHSNGDNFVLLFYRAMPKMFYVVTKLLIVTDGVMLINIVAIWLLLNMALLAWAIR